MSLVSLKINNANDSKRFDITVELNSKFKRDTCDFEDDDYLIVICGVILNKTEIFKEEKDSWETFLISLYKKTGEAFYKIFRGSFFGIFYDKRKDKWIVFQDHIGSKNVYFTCFEDGSFLFSNQISDIYKSRELSGLVEVLDVNAAYMLLSYGFLLEDCTLSKNIKKMCPGSYIKIVGNQLSHHNYYIIGNQPNENLTESEIIDQMDQLFRQAVKRQFDKDLEYNYKHFVALSGGLDSRMTSWVANDMGYCNQLNFTFSQSDYLDETIPKTIARGLKHEWLFKALDNGLFLYNPDEISQLTGGHAMYHGLGHAMSLYKFINYEELGLCHSGQLGDVVYGSFNQNNKDETNYTPHIGAYSYRFIHKVNDKKELTKKYKNAEMFSMYQRGFNGANNGLIAIQQYTETMSPFYDVDVLNFAMSIPVKYRSKQKIYKKWILEKYPAAAGYKWEKTGEKIKSRSIYINNTEVTLHKIKTKILLKLGIKKMGHNSKNNMNPLDYWLDTNNDLKQHLNNYFEEHISLISDNVLKEDCITHYSKGSGIEKMQVISLLSALNLFFNKKV